MTVTRQPTGQDLVCLVCGTDRDIDIDHVQAKGMGGSKERDVPENKTPLCRGHHDAKHNRVLETRLREARSANEPWRMFFEWRRNDKSAPWISVPVEVSQRYKCLVGRLSDGAEETPVPPIKSALSGDGTLEAGASSVPSLSQEEESDEGIGTVRPLVATEVSDRASDTDSARGGVDGWDSTSASPGLTHEQRVAIAQEIKSAEWNRQWIAGDTGNAWIAELGEEAEQYLSDFGYVHESLANILRVCAAIPAPYRNGSLRYSHHVVVYQLPREDQVLWLKECEAEGWSVAEFRRLVHGPSKKAKRWPMEELLAGVEEWPNPIDRPRPKGAVRAYLKWLGGLGDVLPPTP